jgi:DNA anti-recombination protein RmuC
VVLFLPNEMFFSAALDQMPDLYDYAAARDVVLATPTTLIGLLRAVAYGWKQAALAESAAEVFRLGRDLHAKLGLMGNRLDKLGRAIRSSVNAYNETIATVEGTVLVRARRFRDLRVSDADLAALPQLDDAVRQIQARSWSTMRPGRADGRPAEEAGEEDARGRRGPRRPSWSAASPTCSPGGGRRRDRGPTRTPRRRSVRGPKPRSVRRVSR